MGIHPEVTKTPSDFMTQHQKRTFVKATYQTHRNNAKNTLLYNYSFWADYRDDIDAKFQAWLAK